MSVISNGPFAGVAIPAGICVQTSQDNINTEIDKIIALFVDPDANHDPEGPTPLVNASPDFVMILPETSRKIRDELGVLKTQIDAMAVA